MKIESPAKSIINVADFIDQRITWLGKPVQDVADECGFPKPNVVSMIRSGKTKMPIAKIRKMALALKVDPIYFLNLVMSEYDPDSWRMITEIIERTPISGNEQRWIDALRAAADNTDPPCPDDGINFFRAALRKT